MTQGRSPTAQSAPPLEAQVTTRDFSFLLRPEIYHQISPLTVPPPFRNPAKLPGADTPIPKLLEDGHFRAAAIAAAQELTGSSVPPGLGPLKPTDHRRIFDLLYIRLSCLCLIDAVPLAAQEAKALEDLNSAFYTDEETDAHLAPWPLRTLSVRLQTIGFGDPRRAVMSYYELAREARVEVARAAKAHDHSSAEMWKRRLADLGIKVAGALIEMEDLAGAAAHLASLPEAQAQAHDNEKRDGGRVAMCRALLWLHLGDVDAARRSISSQQQDPREETVGRVIDALADMADGDYDTALQKWKALWDEMRENEINDEMVGVNLAVCLLYTGQMSEVRLLAHFLLTPSYVSPWPCDK
jgi:trafficking protein particle complex subunit 12